MRNLVQFELMEVYIVYFVMNVNVICFDNDTQ